MYLRDSQGSAESTLLRWISFPASYICFKSFQSISRLCISAKSTGCFPTLFGSQSGLEFVLGHYPSRSIGVRSGVPDAFIYHKAAIFTCILDWFHHSSSKLWVQLEGHMNPIDLWALPWNLPVFRKGLSIPVELTRQTLYMWDLAIPIFRISKVLGPMAPFFGTLVFLPTFQA